MGIYGGINGNENQTGHVFAYVSHEQHLSYRQVTARDKTYPYNAGDKLHKPPNCPIDPNSSYLHRC